LVNALPLRASISKKRSHAHALRSRTLWQHGVHLAAGLAAASTTLRLRATDA
jgi:hypothetical protein